MWYTGAFVELIEFLEEVAAVAQRFEGIYEQLRKSMSFSSA